MISYMYNLYHIYYIIYHYIYIICILYLTYNWYITQPSSLHARRMPLQWWSWVTWTATYSDRSWGKQREIIRKSQFFNGKKLGTHRKHGKNKVFMTGKSQLYWENMRRIEWFSWKSWEIPIILLMGRNMMNGNPLKKGCIWVFPWINLNGKKSAALGKMDNFDGCPLSMGRNAKSPGIFHNSNVHYRMSIT